MARSAQEQPRDVQKHLRNDPSEFQENRKFELQGASGAPRDVKSLTSARWREGKTLRFPAIRREEGFSELEAEPWGGQKP